MPPSWRLALNILAARRTRTALMLGAVGLSASLIVAVSATLISAQAALEWSLARFIGAADCRIIHPATGRFGDGLLETVRGWPEVEFATGRLGASLVLLHEDRRIDPETGRRQRLAPNAVGLDFDVERHFRHFELLAGRMPAAAHEILIDPLAVERLGTDVGDVLLVDRHGDPQRLEVVGVYRRQRLGALQRPRIYVDRQLLGAGHPWAGQLSSIYIRLVEGADPEAFCGQHRTDIPETLVLEPADMVRTGLDQRVRANQIALLVGTILTFMGAGFIIGGFCPGTSLVAAATLKLDGLFFVLGVIFGIFIFGETVSNFNLFWTRPTWGALQFLSGWACRLGSWYYSSCSWRCSCSGVLSSWSENSARKTPAKRPDGVM